MEPKILYEDKYILALDKPAGLLVHSDGRPARHAPARLDSVSGRSQGDAGGSKEKTLVDWLHTNRSEIDEVGEPQKLQNGEIIKRPGIVHRLDKDTSGVIIVAKTKEAFSFLKDQFQKRKVEKIYNAVVWGNFPDDKKEGIIKTPIGRSASDFRKWSAEHGAKGELREAVTEYKVINIKRGEKEKKEIAYLEVKPKTGRTHQIRVHLKSIGHPVVGDKLYGIKGSEKLKSHDRLMLHAVSIKLELPDGTHIKVESPLPEEFEETKNGLK